MGTAIGDRGVRIAPEMLLKLADDVAHFRHHFNAMYMTGTPRLLDETESFLAFICIFSAIDTLVGLHAPIGGTGQRLRRFVTQFFFIRVSRAQWGALAISQSHDPCGETRRLALVCDESRLHLTPTGWVTVLNTEDCYAELTANFPPRVQDKDGGATGTYIATHLLGALASELLVRVQHFSNR
jgi:hypothetical protein